MVEGLEALEEFITVQGALGELGDDFFDFGGDYIAMGEVGIIENLAKDALGEQVLDQHALDGFFREVGIDGLAAEREEIFKGVKE